MIEDGERQRCCFDQYGGCTKSWIDESRCCCRPSGMEVVKIGGPVYRIGVGGGAASSVEVRASKTSTAQRGEDLFVLQFEGEILIDCFQVQGDNSSDRDLNAVQRGDAEMEQKMNRALRACLERSDGNPICSIHDQGAGGNGGKLTSAFQQQKQSLSKEADADAVTHSPLQGTC